MDCHDCSQLKTPTVQTGVWDVFVQSPGQLEPCVLSLGNMGDVYFLLPTSTLQCSLPPATLHTLSTLPPYIYD